MHLQFQADLALDVQLNRQLLRAFDAVVAINKLSCQSVVGTRWRV